jgi:hypothetical protein
MKQHILIIMLCGSFFSIEGVEKIKVTIYNNGPESILVNLDTQPEPPLPKNSIDIEEGKNFYLPDLTERQPYYLIIEGSGAEGKKEFTVRYNPKKQTVSLFRGDLELSHLDHQNLQDGINIAYYGSLKPAIPEVALLDL